MTAILLIGVEEETAIASAIAEAKRQPVSLEIVNSLAAGCPQDATEISLADMQEAAERRQREYPPQQVMLGNMRCAFSYEEQPAGMVRHLSVSSPNAGKLPSPQAMQMICEAFGFGSEFPPEDSRIWMEEYEQGKYAVNVIQVDHEFSVAEG